MNKNSVLNLIPRSSCRELYGLSLYRILIFKVFMKRGQIGVEYIMVVGIATLLITSILIISYYYNS